MMVYNNYELERSGYEVGKIKIIIISIILSSALAAIPFI